MLTPSIIQKLLSDGEGFTVEFKKCRDGLSSTVYETVCSFSNRYGGHILMGIDDNGKVIGVNPEAVPGMKRDFINTLNNKQKISPPLYLELDEIRIDGKIILHVYVPIGSMPEICSGKLFDRNQDADIDITASTALAADLYDRKRNYFSERRLFPYVDESDLRLSELMPKVKIMAQIKNPNHPWRNMTDMEIMQSANLYEKDQITGQKGFNLAGILLFGKDETIFSCCPGYVTDCILRKVDLDRYDDRLMVKANIIDAFGLIMDFIRKHTPDPFYLEGIQNVSIRDKIAREIVSNSLGHREYSSTIPARIVIEQNRIYADNRNRSNLYGKLDPATFSPNPKNPALARFFVNIGYADTLGSGVRNLYKYTPIYVNGAEPELIEGDNFRTIIPLPAFSSNLSTTQTVDKVVDKPVDKVVDKLTQTEYEFFETLLPYFAEHPAIDAVTAKDISKKSPTSVRRYFNKLVKLGFIETTGANKNRVYRPLPGFSSNLSTTRTVDKPVDKLTQTNE